KHFDADCVRPDFLARLKGYVNHGLDKLEDDFRPIIKAKIPLVIVSGNHDEYLEEIGLSAELTRRLGGSARYLGGEGFSGSRRAADRSGTTRRWSTPRTARAAARRRVPRSTRCSVTTNGWTRTW